MLFFFLNNEAIMCHAQLSSGWSFGPGNAAKRLLVSNYNELTVIYDLGVITK
jgi:hypothetical protein